MGRLIDADTIDLPKHGPVRLAGVDAPENGQSARDARGREFDAGAAAREAFAAYLHDRQQGGWQVCVTFARRQRDRYGRTIGSVTLERGRRREDACAWLVRNGWAVAEYGPPDYSREERRARRERAGLWAGQWQRPRDWRAARRGKRPARRRSRRSGIGGILLVLRILARIVRIARTFR